MSEKKFASLLCGITANAVAKIAKEHNLSEDEAMVTTHSTHKVTNT